MAEAVPPADIEPCAASVDDLPPSCNRLRAAMKRPFEGHYGTMLAIALGALVPYILLTTASSFYRADVTADIGIDATGLEIIAGLATAGYCFGALLGGDLINRYRQHHLFLIFEALFVAGALLSGLAGGLVTYGAGRVLSGLATGHLLVIALPPVIRRFPAAACRSRPSSSISASSAR